MSNIFLIRLIESKVELSSYLIRGHIFQILLTRYIFSKIFLFGLNTIVLVVFKIVLFISRHRLFDLVK